MKNIHTIALLYCIALLHICGGRVYAQEVNAALAEFTPEAFAGYPQNGTFLATFGKTSGTVPAGTAQVIFTMVPQVPWNLQPITTPVGWTLAQNSTPTNIRFVLTEDWNNASKQNPEWIIPVTTTAPRSDQSLAVISQIQQLDGDWTISAPLTRVSITVGEAALPVTLTSFTASLEGKSALLKWTTTEETNSEKFEIQRSLDGLKWNVLGSVQSKGESSVLSHYSFIDAALSNGENLYRLKMIDKDNTFAYSSIQNLSFTGTLDPMVIFPNPSSGQIVLGVKDLNMLKSVKIYNLAGKAIYSVGQKDISRTLNVQSLTDGAYVVEFAFKSGNVQVTKIVIVQ